MQNNDTKGSLGSKFESFGAAPSEGLWGSIADSLDGKKKRKAAIWWWLGAAAVAIAGVGIVFTNLSGEESSAANNNSNVINNNTNETVIPADQNETANQAFNGAGQFISAVRKSDQSSLDQNRYMVAQQNIENRSNGQTVLNDVNIVQEHSVHNSNTRIEPDRSPQNVQETIVQTNALNDDQDEGNTIVADHNDLNDEGFVDEADAELLEAADRLTQLSPEKLNVFTSTNAMAPITASTNRKNRWELGLTVSRYRSLQTKSGYALPEIADDTAVFSENAILESINNNNVVRVIRPIGLNFYAGYRLTERLRIVSGIATEYSSYSYLKDLNVFTAETSDSESLLAIIPVKIMSIGVPIGLEFDFLKRRRFQMGLGMRLLNEFPILETYRPDYDLNYVGPESKNRTFISGYNLGYNFSLNASVNLTEKMRLQACPSMRFYQSQKSSSTLNLPKRDFWLGGSLGLIWELGK